MAEKKIPSTGNPVADIVIGAVALIGTAIAGFFVGKKQQANKDKASMQKKEGQIQELIRKRDALARELETTSKEHHDRIRELEAQYKIVVAAIKAKKG